MIDKAINFNAIENIGQSETAKTAFGPVSASETAYIIAKMAEFDRLHWAGWQDQQSSILRKRKTSEMSLYQEERSPIIPLSYSCYFWSTYYWLLKLQKTRLITESSYNFNYLMFL